MKKSYNSHSRGNFSSFSAFPFMTLIHNFVLDSMLNMLPFLYKKTCLFISQYLNMNKNKRLLSYKAVLIGIFNAFLNSL